MLSVFFAAPSRGALFIALFASPLVQADATTAHDAQTGKDASIRGSSFDDKEFSRMAISWVEKQTVPYVVPCFSSGEGPVADEREQRRCCGNERLLQDQQMGGEAAPLILPDGEGVASAPTCFDAMYTRKECCAPGHETTLFPLAVPDTSAGRGGKVAEMVEQPIRNGNEPGAIASTPRSKQRLRHPSFSEEQRRFERLHLRSTRLQQVFLHGAELRVADFKYSQKVRIISEELQSDPYQLGPLSKANLHNALFLDVGANVGIVSMLLARLNPTARVLALEPVPELYRYFLWSLKLNNLTNRVWPLNAGIGGEGCRSVFYPLESSLYWLPNLVWSESPCLSLAQILQVLRRLPLTRGLPLEPVVIDLMKLDCEGCEYSAFASEASRTLVRLHVRRLAGEVHETCCNCSGSGEVLEKGSNRSFEEVLQLLCTSSLGGPPGRRAVVNCDEVQRQNAIHSSPPPIVVTRRT